MSTKGIDVKERIRAVVDFESVGFTINWKAKLRALLADLEAEDRKMHLCKTCGKEKCHLPFNAFRIAGNNECEKNWTPLLPAPAEPPRPTEEQLVKDGVQYEIDHYGSIVKDATIVWVWHKWSFKIPPYKPEGYIYSAGISPTPQLILRPIPKPTGEQLKAKHPWDKLMDWLAKDYDATPDEMRAVLEGQNVDVNGFLKRVHEIVEMYKPSPQPAQMICNHAGECNEDVDYCDHKMKHDKNCRCGSPCGHVGGVKGAVCVPWVEPVKRDSCKGCKDHYVFPVPVSCRKCSMGFSNWTPKQPEPVKHYDLLPCPWCGQIPEVEMLAGFPCIRHTNNLCPVAPIVGWSVCVWNERHTPKQPEPAAPDSDIMDDGHGSQWSAWCPTCGHKTMVIVRPGKVQCNSDQCNQREPKAEPGLVPYPIIGGKGNELWLVQRPAGAIALYKAVGRTDFAYIETEIGDKFISMQAFDDPPRRAWFRETK